MQLLGFTLPDVSTVPSYLLEPKLPMQLEYLPYVIIGVLALAALVDAFSGRVPDSLMIVGGALAIFLPAYYAGWGPALLRLLMAAIAFVLLQVVNQTYINLCRREAFGMGDVKWTAVAAATFGLIPVFWAWVLGAWLGILWLGLRKLVGLLFPAAKPEGYVHFAPFLLAGLAFKVYALPMLMPIRL